MKLVTYVTTIKKIILNFKTSFNFVCVDKNTIKTENKLNKVAKKSAPHSGGLALSLNRCNHSHLMVRIKHFMSIAPSKEGSLECYLLV